MINKGMNKDIRNCPWTLEVLNGKQARVYTCDGVKAGVTEVKRAYPHAPVYIWTLQFPDGHCQEMDLAEINKLINTKKL